MVGVSLRHNLLRKLTELLFGKDLATFLGILSKNLDYLLLIEFDGALTIL